MTSKHKPAWVSVGEVVLIAWVVAGLVLMGNPPLAVIAGWFLWKLR